VWLDRFNKRCGTVSDIKRRTYVTRRLGVLENRVLRRIFAHKRDEVTRGWRKLHN
jgi:hypothetical protein